MELCAKNARGAGRSSLAKLLERSPLLSDNHLHDEIVFDAHAILAVHIAKRLEGNVASSVELDINFALLKIGLPAGLDLFVGNGANVFMENALALTTDLADVLGAGGSDELLRFFDAPVEFAQPPACLRIGLVLYNAGETHLNGEVTNGMDDWGKLDRGGQVGRREDANRVLLISREDGALDLDIALVGDLAGRSCSDGGEIVIKCGEAAMCGSRQVSRQQVAEGEAVWAMAQRCRMG